MSDKPTTTLDEVTDCQLTLSCDSIRLNFDDIVSVLSINYTKEDDSIPSPTYARKGDAGLDCYSPVEAVIKPGERVLIPSGLRFAVPAGWELQVRPKSGLALKHGITVLNTPGTIDSGYRGIVGFIIINHGTKPFVVEKNMKIAQLVASVVPRVELNLVDSLDDTERGDLGFGGTGKY